MSSSQPQSGLNELTTIQDLVDRDLSGYQIKEMYEIYQMDEEERTKSRVVGYYHNKDIVDAYLDLKRGNGPRFGLYPVFVLYSGSKGFLIDGKESVEINGDQELLNTIRQETVGVLPDSVRNVLGLNDQADG